MKKIAANRNYKMVKEGDDLNVGGPAIYIVTMDTEYEGSNIQAVFSSEAKAQAAIDAAPPVKEWDGFSFNITSYKLDEIPDKSWKLSPADDDDEDVDWD